MAYIDVEKAIKHLRGVCVAKYPASFYHGIFASADEISKLPTADVVEVVRCKDCKHSSFVKSCSKYECRKGCGTLKYCNDFCSYGERRETE